MNKQLLFSYIYIFIFPILINNGFSYCLSQTSPNCDSIIPYVDFSYIQPDICAETPVSFTPNITGEDYEYNWSFGDGTTSDNESPSHVFKAYGCNNQNFNVQLAISKENCSKNANRTINVLQTTELRFEDPLNGFENCENNPNDTNKTFTIRLQNITNEICLDTYNTIYWGDGESTTSFTFPIEHTYDELGIFKLSVVATNDNGCISTFRQNVINQSNPAVGIDCPANVKGMSSVLATFKLNGYENNSPGTYYIWKLGDGTTERWEHEDALIKDSITHQFTRTSCDIGSYNCDIITSVTAYNGCDDAVASCDVVDVYECPKIENINITGNLCENSELTFSSKVVAGCDNSCSRYTYYLWDFVDSITSNNETTTHSFADEGIYTVTLQAWNKLNICRDNPAELQKTITILSRPEAELLVDNNNDCLPLTTNLTNLSTGDSLSFLWRIISSNKMQLADSTSRDQMINFTEQGTYVVQLNAINRCDVDTASSTITVYDKPDIQINKIENICSTDSILKIAPEIIINSDGGQPINRYYWDFPGGIPQNSTNQNPDSIQYSNYNIYSINVEAENMCGISNDSLTFIFKEEFEISAGQNSEICNDSIILSATPDNGYWTSLDNVRFDDTNSVQTIVQVYQSGLYNFIYTVNDTVCGINSDTVEIFFNTNPIDNIGLDHSVCGKHDTIPSIVLMNHGLLYSPDSLVYITNDSIIVPSYGEFFLVWENRGCSEIKDTMFINFKIKPEASTGEDKIICIDDTATIIGMLDGYTDIGQGIWISDIYNPEDSIYFADSTYAQVKVDALGSYKYLWQVSFEGCQDIDTIQLNFYQQPEASSIISYLGDTVFCGFNKMLPVNLPEGFYGLWSCSSEEVNFENINDSTILSEVSHEGIYNLKFVVDNKGCTDSAEIFLSYLEIPYAGIDISKINCDTLSDTLQIEYTRFEDRWEYPDSVIISNYDSYYHIQVPTVGRYEIIRIVDNDICTDSVFYSMNFQQSPQAKFEIYPECGTDTTTIRIRPEIKNVADCDCFWVFGVGNDSVCDPQIPYRIKYPPPSGRPDTIYTINLRVENSYCGRDEMQKDVEILALPELMVDTFICASDYNNMTVQLNSFYPDRYPTESVWYFGDGTISHNLLPEHSYKNDGLYDTVYTTVLITENECGTDTFMWNIRVVPDTVVASFMVEPDTVCYGERILFTNMSSVNEYELDLDDGNILGLSSDTFHYNYNMPGNYLVRQYVYNICNKADTANNNITVHEVPQAYFIVNDTVCKYDTIKFLNLSDTIHTGFLWDFGNQDSSILANPTTVYKSNGTYNVTLIVENYITGCTNEYSQPVYVYLPVPEILIDPTEGCSPVTVHIMNNSLYGNLHYFRINDSIELYQSDPTITLFAGDEVTDYSIYYEVTGANECFDTLHLYSAIKVYPNPKADYDIEELTPYNDVFTGVVRFINLSEGASQYIWNSSIYGFISNAAEPVYEYKNCCKDTITLTAMNEYGCKDSAINEKDISIKGLYIPNAFAPKISDAEDIEVKYFMPKGTCLAEFHIVVYDKYGNLLWESNKIEDGAPAEYWDGKNRDSDEFIPPGVYIWQVIKAKFEDGSEWEGMKYKGEHRDKPVGTVTLIY